MSFRKFGKSVAGALLVTSLSVTLVFGQTPQIPPDEPTNTGTPNSTPTTAPAKPKSKLPVMPAIPAFEQLQKQQFPTKSANPWDNGDELSKPQILCNTFLNLLAEKHFTLTKYEDQRAFLNKWLPKVKDVKTLEEADKLNIEAMESLGQRFDYYMSPDDTAREKNMSDPSIVGIGVSVSLKDMDELLDPLADDAKAADYENALVISDAHPFVVRPFPGSPAAKAGLWDGDTILEIDGKPIKGMKMKDAMALIKGKAGTKVKFKVKRKEDFAVSVMLVVRQMAPALPLLSAFVDQPSDFEVPRVPAEGQDVERTIEVERALYVAPVVHVRQLPDGTTMIKLDNFMANNAAQEMLKALREVAAKKHGRIILDLRNNGGGRLDHAINIVQYMLAEGTIVRLRQREGYNMLNIHYTVTRDALITTQQQAWNPDAISYSAAQRVVGVPESVPIVVLVNRWTASASELTSGALQFHKRAKIVGENSIGKGVGQVVIDLPEGRRTHITTFYFDPAARIMDFEGIHPDVVRTLEKEQKQLKDLRDQLRKLLKFKPADNKNFNDLAFNLAQTDFVLAKVTQDLAKATTDAQKSDLTKQLNELKAKKEKLSKETDALAKKLVSDNEAQLTKVKADLKDLHKMLQENDPQVQEARKLVIQEEQRLEAEAKAKVEARKTWTEKKLKEWEKERKLRDEMKKKTQQEKKAA